MLQPQTRLQNSSDTNGKLTLRYGITFPFSPNNEVLLLLEGFCWAIWPWKLRSWGWSRPVTEVPHLKRLHGPNRGMGVSVHVYLWARGYWHFNWIGQSRKNIGGNLPVLINTCLTAWGALFIIPPEFYKASALGNHSLHFTWIMEVTCHFVALARNA